MIEGLEAAREMVERFTKDSSTDAIKMVGEHIISAIDYKIKLTNLVNDNIEEMRQKLEAGDND